MLAATTCGDLLKDPPELRFQIYEILGTPEKLKMMETCRLICKEMIPVIDREATYHLFVNYPAGKGRRSKLPFREHHGEEIRNVEIIWSLPDVRTTWDYNNVQSMLACRWVPSLCRKHCSMTFECDPSKATFMKQFIFEALRTLAMFETIIVRVVPHEWSEAAGGGATPSRAMLLLGLSEGWSLLCGSKSCPSSGPWWRHPTR